MAKFTINIDAFGFTRAGQTFNVDPSRFNAEIIAQLVMHGATQKIGDAAAGKDGDDALKAMDAVYESLSNGDWGRSRGGAGEEPIARFIRAEVRNLLSKESMAEYKKLAAEEKSDWLDAKFAAQDETNQAAIRAEAEKSMKKAQAEKAANAEKAKKFGISI